MSIRLFLHVLRIVLWILYSQSLSLSSFIQVHIDRDESPLSIPRPPFSRGLPQAAPQLMRRKVTADLVPRGALPAPAWTDGQR